MADYYDMSVILPGPRPGVGVGVPPYLTAKSADFAFHGVRVGKSAVPGLMPPTRHVRRSAVVTGRSLTFRAILLRALRELRYRSWRGDRSGFTSKVVKINHFN